jgi:septal ring factor EnvC (AmiA/AmiB activator)
MKLTSKENIEMAAWSDYSSDGCYAASKELANRVLEDMQAVIDEANTTIYQQRAEITRLNGSVRQLEMENKQIIEDCADINAEKSKAFLKETDQLEVKLTTTRADTLKEVLESVKASKVEGYGDWASGHDAAMDEVAEYIEGLLQPNL